VLRHAAQALVNICAGANAGIQQRAAGIVAPLMQLLSSSQDPGVLQHAAAALGRICSGDGADVKQRAASAGAVGSLAKLISGSQDPDVRAAAVRAMWSVCSSDSASMQEAAAGAGAVEALVQLASSRQPAVCAVCSKPSCRHRKLRLCDACRAVPYCSDRCQRLHWPEHRGECAGVAQQGAST
jgi:hypothetical protein